MRETCVDFLQVLRRQSKPHSQQHCGGTIVNSPERVHRQALPRSGVVVLPADDNREGAPTVVCHPSKSSPFDVLPCSLLKPCTETFSPVIPKLANLSMQNGKFPSRYKQAQKKAGLHRSSPENYRPISNCKPSRRSSKKSCWHACVLICSSQPTSVNISLRTGMDIRRKQRCWRLSTECTLQSVKSRSLCWSVSICRPPLTQLTTSSCSSVSIPSLAWQTNHYLGSVRICKVVRTLSCLASTSHQLSGSAAGLLTAEDQGRTPDGSHNAKSSTFAMNKADTVSLQSGGTHLSLYFGVDTAARRCSKQQCKLDMFPRHSQWQRVMIFCWRRWSKSQKKWSKITKISNKKWSRSKLKVLVILDRDLRSDDLRSLPTLIIIIST